LCRGHPDVFDPPEHGDDHTDTAERIAFAVKACRRCPALAACKAWFNSLPAKERPTGVVAGRVHADTRAIATTERNYGL
jgi:hypothetical protein